MSVDGAFLAQPFFLRLNERARRAFRHGDRQMLLRGVDHVELPAALHDLGRPEPLFSDRVPRTQAEAAVLPRRKIRRGIDAEPLLGVGRVQIIFVPVPKDEGIRPLQHGIAKRAAHTLLRAA